MSITCGRFVTMNNIAVLGRQIFASLRATFGTRDTCAFSLGSLSAENEHFAAKSLNSTCGPLLAISTYVSTRIARDGHLFILDQGMWMINTMDLSMSHVREYSGA